MPQMPTPLVRLRAAVQALAVTAALLLVWCSNEVDAAGALSPDADVVDTMLREQFPANYDGSQLHIVLSNGCGQKNRLLFASVLQLSATRVGQKGPITQIISGCSEEDKKKVLAEPRFYYDYRVHFTPDYSTHPRPEIDDWYLAYNKPFGLRHYLQHGQPPVQHELMALTDGDIMLFQPLAANTGKNVTAFYKGTRDPTTVTDEVRDGVALAQDWTKIIENGLFHDDRAAKMCAGKPCAKVTREEALEYYSGVGPPYIMTKRDMQRFVDDYCDFVVEGRKVSQDWMTEMYGYSVAAANHGIKHTILTNLAPTHPFLNGHEYWSFLSDENLAKNPCEDPYEIAVPAVPPVGVHYFHYYLLLQDGRQFYKGAIPPEILNCDSMMLEVPKASEYDAVFTTYQDNPSYMAQKRAEVWLECTLIKSVNEALVRIKSATCAATGFNSYQAVVMMFEEQR